MTCREKLKLEHPECSGDRGCCGCPYDYGYLDKPEYCRECNDIVACNKCWDREIPEDTPTIIDQLQQRVYDAAGVKASIIKDSGDRTEFSTGAVRDMREGKGRCDLMPLDVVGKRLENLTLTRIHNFQETGDRNELYDILRFSDVFPDPFTMFLEVAKHFEDGAKKYGENNWQKGIPVNCYIDSAVRHYLKFLRGDTDERHDRAFVWNILCCIWTVENKPEMNNYRKEGE